jgi:hypothetical protein
LDVKDSIIFSKIITEILKLMYIKDIDVIVQKYSEILRI